MLLDEEDRAEILRSYVIAHLEEEIRREALVKDWGGVSALPSVGGRGIGSGGELRSYCR